MIKRSVVGFMAFFLLFMPCLVKAGEEEKAPQKEQWVTEKTGRFLPLDLSFIDETGSTVLLGDIIDRPTILLPIYFYCPNICSENLANLATSLGALSYQAGRDFKVIALSFNEEEKFEDAQRSKRNYLKIVGDKFPPAAWPFLTGKRESIKTAMDAVGFRYKNVGDGTFIHPAALMVLAGDGKIIRYVYGSFLAGDIDVALSDAISGKPSSSVKRLLAFCFNYDPDKNKSLFLIVKSAVLVLFATILLAGFFYFRRKGKS